MSYQHRVRFSVVAERRFSVFTTTLLVLGNPGRFFEEQAQLFGARLDNAADRTLADDGVGTRPQTRAQKHVLNVATTHGLVVG